MASSMARLSISWAPARAHSNAASLSTLARSAPVKPGVRTGDHVQIDVRHERLALGVHLQNGLTAFQVRRFHGHLAVETTRAQQCRIKHVGTVGRGDDDQVGVVVEAVHFDKPS